MSPAPPKAFISYSHDSAEHDERVRALADRLCGDGVDCTVDQYDPHPREPWPRWMDRQIEEADFVLVVCTETYLRRAKGLELPGVGLGVTFESVLIIQDLYDAGMWNEKFIPILFDGAAPQSIPKPLRGYTHYRLDAGYESLLRHLRNELKIRKPEVRPGAPLSPADSPKPSSQYRCMAQEPEEWVPRREYDQVLEALCSKTGAPAGRSVGITTALRGAGGFGKTALARKLCFDPKVREAYPDGILWATMGEEADSNSRLREIRDLLRWWTEEEPPAFETVAAAGAKLRESLSRERVLVVVDDVWSPDDVAPFQGLGESCALLITTRDSRTLPKDSTLIKVDAMASSEAVDLLRAGLPASSPEDFRSLAANLGEWPLLLKLVNGPLREMVKEGLSISKALREIEGALENEGFSAFDQNDSASRHAAASRAFHVSVRRLPEAEQAFLFELAIFPEDEDIPVSVLERYWGLSHYGTTRICQHLYDLSLLLEFDRKNGTIRLHDVTRRVLIGQRPGELSSLHSRLLLEAYRPTSGRWEELPENETYVWKRLTYHFVEAGMKRGLRKLLSSFPFLEAKLRVTDVNALIADYEPLAGENQELRLIRDALRLSSHVLAKDQSQLSSQLLGRLRDRNEALIRVLVEGARSQQKFMGLWPKMGGLTQPGGALLLTLEGHRDRVTAVTVLDGRRAVSASHDQTLRVWDLQNGQSLKTLEGHKDWVTAVAAVDSQRVVSASDDRTLRVWDLESGLSLKTLEGHRDWVRAVVVIDGRRAISASDDRTLRVWDLESGLSLKVLEGHSAGVTAVAALDRQRVVSASKDGTLRVWDLKSGQTIKSLGGCLEWITAVAALDDLYVISASEDRMLQVLDLESGQTLKVLKGHSDEVNAVAVLGGQRIISASNDGTLRVWDLESGKILRVLEGRSDWITAVAVMDDRRAVSGSNDGTLRVWDLESGQSPKAVLEGHSDAVTAVAMIDNQHAASASKDGTLRVWDLKSCQIVKTHEGHVNYSTAVAVLDGWRAISAFNDQGLRMWDLKSGQTLKALEGYGVGATAVAVLDGRRAISAFGDGSLRVWDLESGKLLKTFEGDTDWWATAVAMRGSNSGQTLTPKGHTAGVNAVTMLDGWRAISASKDGTLRIWDLESGQTLKTLEGHRAGVTAVTALAGRGAISASKDMTLRVWDLESGQIIKILKGHTAGVNAVAVVNSRLVVSASNDGTVRVWDLQSGEASAAMTLEAPVLAVAVTHDGKMVVAGDRSGRVHFLDLVEPEPSPEGAQA